ncbi:tRNA uridine-5-carboxymethylaminomethyl(34) synthesis GTPase MnmE [Schaedlerella arabinosiphila]|uniref:tRNA uridine-5-carboxymethylaminomethyl(34) synthesis GTPase MnmE n=1 Tax=Schaedlerella arabinosiphila TaxID=2044587 RepID=UPI0018760043|nr:tRNA uridine-5-carboxymethylaminomethyl(34) synthesis GTPase MnmE [Schaedlerella arabinosiphila]MDE7066700.1 tRNA uridine-5-carboxymethylaminomethyl(34) synthesis GTPase MnmE [Schaedlerella arabinosiphila]
MLNRDTIAAISTGMSASGIGIVRISGEQAFEVIDRIFHGKEKLSGAKSHTIHYGFIMDGEDTADEVLVSVMRSPRTFTGENTVEINCHGGMFVVKKVLEIVLENGARLAEPGEFTKRAFLNGRMDLSQAEAVMDVIHSQNSYALKSSVGQLRGNVKRKIGGIREKILYHTAFIESALDDPEHISIDGYGEELEQVLDELTAKLEKLIRSYDSGRIIKEGIQTVILGKPNVGKSSLLNILSGRERAIVTDIAGTTRDILEEQVQIQGLNLNVIDTAGIRDTHDMIEKMGVEKAKEYADQADLIIYVADASRELDENDMRIGELIYGKKCIILLNKSDLITVVSKTDLKNCLKEIFSKVGGRLPEEESAEGLVERIPLIDISVKMEQGIREFGLVLQEMFLEGDISSNEEIHITNLRQKEALAAAYDALQRVRQSIRDQMPEDFYSIDLMDAYEALGSITGETIGEDLVNEIFSKFCMGK